MVIKRNNKSFGVFNSLFRYAPQRIEHSKKHPQKVRIYNCEKLGKLNLLFTIKGVEGGSRLKDYLKSQNILNKEGYLNIVRW